MQARTLKTNKTFIKWLRKKIEIKTMSTNFKKNHKFGLKDKIENQ
jgi:hypothetical protein